MLIKPCVWVGFPLNTGMNGFNFLVFLPVQTGSRFDKVMADEVGPTVWVHVWSPRKRNLRLIEDVWITQLPKADLLTFWFSSVGPFLVMAPKG